MTRPGPAQLGELAEFIRGITFKPDAVVPFGTDGSVVCMRTKNVQAVLECDDLLALPADAVRRKDQLLVEGDILVSSANSWNLVGKCCWIPKLPWSASFGGFVSVLRADKQKLHPRFLYWWFSSEPIQALLRSFGQKTTNISNLNIDRCSRLEVPLFSLPEQRRIAAILDQADALRAQRREALAQLDRLTQAIFVEMFGDFKQDPKRWPVAPLGELATDMKIGLVRSSETFGEDAEFDTPYVRMNAIGRGGDFLPDLVQRTSVTPKELSEYRLQVGDILFNTRNSKELVGKTAIFREAGDYVYNNNLMRIRFDHRVNAEYAAQCILTPFIQHELEMRKSGTTNVFAIYGRELNTLPVPLPPLELQRKFALRVAAIQETKSRMQTATRETLQLFTSLQHRAFRGEL